MDFQDFEEDYQKGLQNLFEDEFEKSFQNFSNVLKIIKANENKVLLLRAISALKIGNYESTLEDCNMVLSTNKNSLLSLFLKGQALMKTKEYQTAIKVFETGNRIENTLSKADLKETFEIEMLRKLYDSEEYKKVLKSFTQENQNTCFFWSLWIDNCATLIQSSNSCTEQEHKKTSPVIRNDWNESIKNVYITFYCKDVSKENVKCQFEKNSFYIEIKIPTFSEVFSYRVSKLYGEIIPEESKCNTSQMKVEVLLKKKEEGTHWMSLTELSKSEITVMERKSHSLSKKDWERISEEYEKSFQKEEENNAGGDEKLHKFFNEIYAKADEDTRRAMIKSFQTSGGTVLSTNWNEVKEKQYENEIRPPKGMELRKWEA